MEGQNAKEFREGGDNLKERDADHEEQLKNVP